MNRGKQHKYSKEYAYDLPALMCKGETVCMVCKQWGISKFAFYSWVEKYSDFATAYAMALTLCQAWWEKAGQQGLYDRTVTEFDEKGNKIKTITYRINDRVWARNMFTRFKDWRDTPKDDVTEQDGKIPKEIRDKIAQVFSDGALEADKVAEVIDVVNAKNVEAEVLRIEAPKVEKNKTIPQEPEEQIGSIDWSKVYDEF